MKRVPRLIDWISLLALTVLWGTAFLLNEFALRSFTPSVIVAGRLTVAALMLLIVLRMNNVSVLNHRRSGLPLLLMALLGTVLPFYLTVWAQQYIDSGLTGVLMAVTPLSVACLAHFFIPGEGITRYRVAGFSCGFMGVLCVIGPDSLALVGDNLELLSMLAVLCAAVSYSINIIYTRRIGPGNPTATSTGVLVFASVVALPMAARDVPTIGSPPTGAAVVAVMLLGLLCTGLASVLYYRLVQGPGPNFLSLVNYLIPTWAVFAGALVLGETLSVLVYVGLALILVGIAMSEFGQRLLQTTMRGKEPHCAIRTNSIATEEA